MRGKIFGSKRTVQRPKTNLNMRGTGIETADNALRQRKKERSLGDGTIQGEKKKTDG